ncbi:hypothetical protein PM396_gp06 [Xanthomonas phage vB_Xar_IVIA-DoCa1]|uniref:Uncharacterized protein n=3 Tax=Septimatrevirus TaxID=1921544 RepID=A0A976XIT2_9CAUD|nr:hypothetical protein AVV50_gp12 [Pseudomonas phage PaMx42]YP_010597465.1 hypothetical protein PM394_gp18 [Pseudomonas phage Guyu]YP_010597513.1 hypothetical protein PM395_gp12 [Xanthomonas phage Samson]YP_010597564.1 hypothetical protein PM396_gp06 [Xanthomonas phage vB_Xar_IVIA-DoCa1]UKH49211.1 DNA polymerase III subunits gamma and tau [Pseudomonas phage vB_Pae_TR]UYA98887.1 hypothetical protein IVIADoCa8_6 [Xanthomonas phage vB_Xar_IVIA-DoCa8]ALH23589.1 hypothetical protein PaMx42_12 [Ps
MNIGDNAMKPAKILYFVDGPAPTPEDFAAAAELNASVSFRNARAVPSEAHSLEICDGVAGAVPPIYAEKFPDAAEAIKKKAAELKELTSKVGDSPAPKAKGGKTGQQAPQQPQTPAPATGGQQPAAGQQGGGAPSWNPNPAQ